ncbi:MAG: ATP-dependent Clp protease ATP-binding subunit [Caldilineae bacterium]|nr:ATP-dependent Clp protease ATP-binding subunit [Chloroflexota bacterium]MCB9176642.1 ATP-dependent Clp protease ATP-binding subunit [Caldilineae bacterium]
MDDRFTERARRVLLLAQEEAKRLNDSFIGTEHLLLGLVNEQRGLASRVLRDLGATPIQVSKLIDQASRRAGQGIQGQSAGLSPRTKRVLEGAVDEARRMNHQYIGTEHILLGLINEGDGPAIDVLKEIGVDLDAVRRQTTRAIMQQGAAKPKAERKKPQQTPLMDTLGVDLTSHAEENKLDPVVGRQTEIERVIQILSRRTKNNPALIGEPGVGKTAIVEGLAQRIAAGEVPSQLREKRVFMLDVGSLVAGTIYRGQFEERMKRVLDEIKEADAILFIDELHMLVGAGSAGSSVDAANLLKPALARGELQVIGATTLDEYRKHIESDAALERRFQPIFVNEPSVDDTVKILRGIRSRYEEHHGLTITDEALYAAAHLAERYITDRFLPDKAIDLIDEASSRVRMYKIPDSPGLNEALARLKTVQGEKERAFTEGEYDAAVKLRDQERELWQEIERLRADDDAKLEVNDEDIAEVVAMWTGVPVVRIAGEESERLLQMEQALHERIVSQHEAIEAISKAVRRARAGLKDPRRPIGTYIFLGPTGVGKTELAKALAEFMFGSEDALLQIDMSEFMERHAVSRLVGAPPGYVGYYEGGQLTEAVRRRPYQVILLDEIEKAHPEAFNMLLQIMEDGHLTDAKGRKVDFRNTIIIMTSNIGAARLTQQQALGFDVGGDERKRFETEYEEMCEKVAEEMKRLFKPEFLNRVDKMLVFRPLTREDLRTIVDIQLARMAPRLAEQDLKIEVTDAARDRILAAGYDPEYGARPLRRAIRDLIEDPLSEMLLAGDIQPGDTLHIDAGESDDGLEIRALAIEPVA